MGRGSTGDRRGALPSTRVTDFYGPGELREPEVEAVRWIDSRLAIALTVSGAESAASFDVAPWGTYVDFRAPGEDVVIAPLGCLLDDRLEGSCGQPRPCKHRQVHDLVMPLQDEALRAAAQRLWTAQLSLEQRGLVVERAAERWTDTYRVLRLFDDHFYVDDIDPSSGDIEAQKLVRYRWLSDLRDIYPGGLALALLCPKTRALRSLLGGEERDAILERLVSTRGAQFPVFARQGSVRAPRDFDPSFTLQDDRADGTPALGLCGEGLFTSLCSLSGICRLCPSQLTCFHEELKAFALDCARALG